MVPQVRHLSLAGARRTVRLLQTQGRDTTLVLALVRPVGPVDSVRLTPPRPPYHVPAPDYRRQVATPTVPTKGPWPLLIAGGVSAVIALIVLVLAPLVASPTQGLYFGLAIAGWLLAGIVAFVLLGLYTLKNTQRQAETFYVEDTTQTLLYRIIMGGSFLLVIAAAVEIAFYVGKVVGA